MKLDAILRAHQFMRVERPPLLWEADTEDEAFIRLLGEMIAFALIRSGQLSSLTLNVSNIVVESAASDDRTPAGEYVAVTIRGPAVKTPELVWVPGGPLTFTPFGDLDKAASEAGAGLVYTRDLGREGSITTFLRRKNALA